MRALRTAVVAALLLASRAAGQSGAGDALLYRGLPYGSQATFSPATSLLNVGFEDFLSGASNRDLGEFPFAGSAAALGRGFTHPLASVERFGGWWRIVRSEILPIELSASAGWVPNYGTHLISGSLQTRMLAEWYRAHRVPVPRLLGSLTFLASSYLHEMAQYPTAWSNRWAGASATSLVDLVVFDLPASILGHTWGVTPFLARRWEAASWGPMVSVVVPDRDLTNLGDYWVYKIPLPFWDRTRLFTRVGYGTQLGLTRRLGDGISVSGAVGMDTDRHIVDPVTLDERVTAVQSLWLSVDRDNSLLASVNLSGRAEDRVIVNVYPGVLPGPASGLGVWLVADADGRTRVGVAMRSALGLGAGYSVVQTDHPTHR